MSEFDAKAKTWDDEPKIRRAQVIAEAIRAQVPLNGSERAMDYGCGTGLLGLELLPQVGHMTLADTSEGMLDVLREKIAALGAGNAVPLFLDLADGSSEDAPDLPAAPFDLIVTAMTLHHIDDIDGILRKFRGILADGGTLCVADLDLEDGSFHGDGFHGHHGFDRADLGSKAAAAGFRDVAFSTVHEMERETEQGKRRFSIFLMAAQAG